MPIPDYIQTDDRAYLRDTRSKALLNTDRAALERCRTARKKSLQHALTLQTLQDEVAELKALVRGLLNAHAHQ